MPHVIVKLYPGRSEQQKSRLAEAMVKDVVTIAKRSRTGLSARQPIAIVRRLLLPWLTC